MWPAAWKWVRRHAIEMALTAALGALLDVAKPLFKKVAEALGEAASFLGEQAVRLLISALEELASLATDLARKAEEVEDSQVAADVAKVARDIAREANEMARKLRNLKKHDVASRVMLRKEAQNAAGPQHFGMVPRVQSQGNMFGRVEPGARGASRVPSHADMFGQTFMAEPGAQRVPSSHANMHAGTFMAEPRAHGVARVSSHANMGTGTYMEETGASEAESMIREVEEAARKLKAKVENTHTIPAGQKGRKIEGAQSLTCY